MIIRAKSLVYTKEIKFMRNVIVDASPIICISKANLLNEFRKLAKNFYVTPYILSEIEYPLKHGIKAPEVELLKSTNILKVKELTAKEISKARKIAETYKIGIGEAEAAVLWMRGNFDCIIVADVRALRKLRELKVGVMDVIDVSFELTKKNVNPLQFARKLWENAHYRTERIREMLRRQR